MQENYCEFSQIARAIIKGLPSDVVRTILDGGELVNRAKRSRNETTLLHLAVNKRNCEIVKILLEKGFDVNALDYSYSAPLLYGVSIPDERITQLLLDNGADPNICNYWGETPLHKAIRKSDSCSKSINCIKMLIRHGADIEARDFLRGYTALHVATVRDLINDDPKWSGTIQTLLELGANPHSTTRYGSHTPLHVAVAGGHYLALAKLLKHEVNIEALDEDKATPLHLAAKTRQVSFVNSLLEHGANINARNRFNNTPLLLAIAGNSLSTVRSILKHLPDKSDKRVLALSLGSRSARKLPDPGIYEALVEYGFVLHDLSPVDALWIAIANDDQTTQEYLINMGVQLNQVEDNHLFLFSALKSGRDKFVNLLIKNGVSSRLAQPCSEAELLSYAINQGLTTVVKTLLENGVDPNRNWDWFGQGPIDHLAYFTDNRKRERLFKILVKHGADIDSQSCLGTPLARAFIRACSWSMDRFLINGGDPHLEWVGKKRNRWSSSARMYLIRHINKLLFAESFVSDYNIYRLEYFISHLGDRSVNLSDYGMGTLCEQAYQAEVDRMKQHSLIDGISLHKIFITEDIEYRANQPLVDLLESVDFDEYEEYGDLLIGKLKRDKKLYEYLVRAREGFYSLPMVKHKMLPRHLAARIISHLSKLDQQHLALCVQENPSGPVRKKRR